jgi:hypothetical protein
VNAASGVFRYRKTDLMVPDVIPIVLRRLYRVDDVSPTYKGAFGIGTRHDYQMILSGDGQAYGYADLRLGDGRTLHYTRISPGTDLIGAVMEHTASPMLMLGHTANAPGKAYGTFEYGVPIEAGKTAVLPAGVLLRGADAGRRAQHPLHPHLARERDPRAVRGDED